MKYKKSMLVLSLLICVLFGLSSVCASDVNDTMVTSDDASQLIEDAHDKEVVSSSEEEVIASSQNEDVLGAKDDGTFTALQNKIDNANPNSAITLENDYKYNSGFDTHGVTISKNLTINGNGHIINGLSKSRIFKISSGNKVVLNNIKFYNANAYQESGSDEDGGAIYTKSDLVVENCKFVNNKGCYGGAICFWCCCGTIKNSVFEKNNVGNNGGAIYFSGDIYLSGRNYVSSISNSKFISNVANEGGAIYNALDTLKLDHCQFKDNAVQDYGGAIYNSGRLIINYGSFYDNAAGIIRGTSLPKALGNSICNRGNNPYMEIANSKFIKDGSKNVAIYNDNKLGTVTCKISNTIFSDVDPAEKIKLTLKKVKVKKSAKKLVLKATLKQGKTPLKGKKIKFKFNGKKYSAKTNKKGIAKVTIKKKVLKKLKVGKKVKYQVSYGKIIVKKTAKVKK